MNALRTWWTRLTKHLRSARKPALVAVAVGLLLGLGGAAASGASKAPALPMDPPPEAIVNFTDGCVYVPQMASGWVWFWYCPTTNPPTNGQVRLRDNGGKLLYNDWGQACCEGQAPEEYWRLQAAQTAWSGNCDDLTLRKGECKDWASTIKAKKPPNTTRYGPDSFWQDGNNDPSVSRPCEFLKAISDKLVCLDPRDDPPCPTGTLGASSQLLRNCESQNAAVITHFKYEQQTPGSQECDTTGGAPCDYDPGQPVANTEFKDEEFLEAPIQWTAARLREAVGQVSLWWILAPEPLIDSGKDTGINVEQNVNFLVRHTNVITLGLVALSIVIASIRISLTRQVQHAQDVVRSIVILVLVSGLSVLVINALVAMSSWYSTWILVRGLNPSSEEPLSRAAGQEAATAAIESFTGDLDNLNFVLLVLLSLCLLAGGLVQWVYMIVRIPVVTILAGTLPLAAAATNTEVGKSWMSHHLTYLGAFILVKPASVTVFVASARLFGSNSASASGPEAQFRGAVILLLMSLLLPALVKMIFPVVAPATGGQAASTTMVGGVLAGGARLVKR
ncbi:MAG TPA: hypothetical protein VLH10_09165 [Yinghuangia sp.]|uniref:hypothetical protein n=1 Tax=Yinghuangia sp. YIM S10712 TaxID=3436930 RepID=UPI002D189E84|nr:hypothetical protein [Yinghuangia sp.]